MARARLSHVNFPEDCKELSFEREKFGLIKTRITLGSHIEKNRNKLLLACSTLLPGAFCGQTRLFCFSLFQRSYFSNVLGKARQHSLARSSCGFSFLGFTSWEALQGWWGLWCHQALGLDSWFTTWIQQELRKFIAPFWASTWITNKVSNVPGTKFIHKLCLGINGLSWSSQQFSLISEHWWNFVCVCACAHTRVCWSCNPGPPAC